jgi:hypothetical protein
MIILRIIGGGLLLLAMLAALTMFLLPLNILQNGRGIFMWSPEVTLWLLLILSISFAYVFFRLGPQNGSRWTLLKVVGSLLLVLGFASATEIFLLEAYRPDAQHVISVWGLFVLCCVAGGVGVYFPVRAERIKGEAEEEQFNRLVLEAEALRKKERNTRLRILGHNVSGYFAHHQAVRVKRRLHLTTHRRLLLSAPENESVLPVVAAVYRS